MAASVTSPVSGRHGHAGELLRVPVVPADDQLEQSQGHHDAADDERPQSGLRRRRSTQTHRHRQDERADADAKDHQRGGRIGQGTGGRRLLLLPLRGQLLGGEVLRKVNGMPGAPRRSGQPRGFPLRRALGCCCHDHFVPLRLMLYFSTRDLYLAA